MTKNEELAIVLDLACLTEDRDLQEQRALLQVARRVDAEFNKQTTVNIYLRDQPEVVCTFKPGPPEEHGKCKCSGSGGRMLVRMPKLAPRFLASTDGWSRWEQQVEDTIDSGSSGAEDMRRVRRAVQDVVVSL